MDLADVPRTDADFRPKRLGGTPRIVTGAVGSWPAMRRWTPRYLKDVAGDADVMVRETVGPPRNVFQNLSEGGSIAFCDYIEWIVEVSSASDVQQAAAGGIAAILEHGGHGFERSYYFDTGLSSFSERLAEDVAAPEWYDRPPVDALFWCGVLGTSSGLHFDVKPNCNVQVRGRKHFILFAPSEARFLYRKAGGAHCRFDPNRPDFERYPLARKASGLRCTLEEGECLYIPPGWLHQVTAVSPWTINVNFFWDRQFPQGLATPLLWPLLLRRAHAHVSKFLRRTSKDEAVPPDRPDWHEPRPNQQVRAERMEVADPERSRRFPQ